MAFVFCSCFFVFFFKQKTAYEMRISDWSSDVCSSDLTLAGLGADVVEATPDLADTEAVFRIHWYSGAANLLQRFDAAAQATMEPGLQEVAAEEIGRASCRERVGQYV